METADNKCVTLRSLMNFFSSKIADYSERTHKIYRSSINSLRDFFPSDTSISDVLCMGSLSQWVVNLLSKGLKVSTLMLYINNISGLLKYAEQEGLVAKTDAFKQLRKQIDGRNIEPLMQIAQAQRVLRLAMRPANLFADMLLVSLSNGAMPILSVAKIKNADVAQLDENSREFAVRNQKSGYSYVFPLDQGNLTRLQLQRKVESGVAEVLKSLDIPIVGNVDDTVKTLWAHLAMMVGGAPSEIVGRLGGVPRGLPALALCAPHEYCESSLDADVAHLLLNNPLQWYAMKLRRGVEIDEIKARKAQIAEIFYPCEEIIRRVGKKMKQETRPVLPDVAFFRSRQSEILPIFAKIGDLAWGYKYFDNGQSRYAVIPQSEMDSFQRAIGQFTADYDVAPIGGLSPQEGDKIQVVGGIFAGKEFEFEGANECDTATIYRLRILGDNGIEWRIKSDARMTTKRN